MEFYYRLFTKNPAASCGNPWQDAAFIAFSRIKSTRIGKLKNSPTFYIIFLEY